MSIAGKFQRRQGNHKKESKKQDRSENCTGTWPKIIERESMHNLFDKKESWGEEEKKKPAG